MSNNDNIVAHTPVVLSAPARARVARQTGVVHELQAPVKRRHRDREPAILDGPYGVLGVERDSIRCELAAAGLL